jgi:hypothetical protein
MRFGHSCESVLIPGSKHNVGSSLTLKKSTTALRTMYLVINTAALVSTPTAMLPQSAQDSRRLRDQRIDRRDAKRKRGLFLGCFT